MYEVGQVLYTILEKQKQILPLKIVEEVRKKTLEGELTEYFVQIPTDKTTQTYNLSIFKDLHDNIEVVKEILVNNAKKSIDDIVSKTLDLENKFFNTNIVIEKELVNDTCKNDSNNIIINTDDSPNDFVNIDLGDGQIGKINVKSVEELLDQKKT